ncbi:Archaeal TRASH domain protein [Botrimarina hoheduenensis]|uniref:Archaeal TRASH domain protein n=2 Tax=Botrimarina hoheduenensis TaxID=2528000 RepID=A0A5C5VY42_9BACT|nr:Archaeal TRASH domain protein [Botrimarina hoheduenensis]
MRVLNYLVLACGLAIAVPVFAQHDHTTHGSGHKMAAQQPPVAPPAPAVANDQGPHGGRLADVGAMQIETVIAPSGIRLFAYNEQKNPLDLRDVRGVATLQVQGDAKRYRYDLFAETRSDGSAEALAVAVDLSPIAGRQIELAVQLAGLSGPQGQPVRFQTTAVAPRTEAQQVAAAIAEQKVCPVSGQPLGSMGRPIPVQVGDRTVYVCCAGCIDAVKDNPSQYVIGKPMLKVAPATDADAAAIAAQKLCPVMDEPLGSMGTPLKVTGLPRDVYLCCKGCLKFLEKEPQKYLAKLPAAPGTAKPEITKATAADAPFVAAQKLCPVMDEPLDAMGGPYRTVVEGRVVYLCCPGCAKKLHADPQGYLQKLAQQGVEPPRVR